MKKEELKRQIVLTKNEQKTVIDNSISLSEAARKIVGNDTTLARTIIKELCEDNNWSLPDFYNRKYYCLNCGKEITSPGKSKAKFCSHSCSATYNNKLRGHKSNKTHYCLNCGKELEGKSKFCNNTCYAEYNYKQYIERWKMGKESGVVGKYYLSNKVKRYLFIKHNNSCEKCGWSEVNPITNIVPLQIHHIDGNCMNNTEDNLQVLCPNCHSLTETFGRLNSNSKRFDRHK